MFFAVWMTCQDVVYVCVIAVLALILIAVHRFTTEMSQPTYKELIQLLSEAEKDQSDMQSTAELLAARFRDLYPHVSISRPGRFLETVRRIAGPIQNSKLKGVSRKLYLKRRWSPRSRNTVAQGMPLRT